MVRGDAHPASSPVGVGRRPPRVLFVINNLGIGGAQVVLCDLVERLVEMNWPVTVCAWRLGGALEGRLRRAGVRLRVPTRERGAWRRGAAYLELGSIIRQERIEVIHAHMSDSAVWGVLLQQRHGVPCIVTHQNDDIVDTVALGRPLHRFVRTRLVLWAAARAFTNAAVSEGLGRRLVQVYGVPESRTVVVANGVRLPDPGEVEAGIARRAARTAQAGRVVLCMGRLVTPKDFATIIDAAPNFLGRLPNVSLVVVGDGPQAAALRARAAERGVEARVHFTGWRLDTAQCMADADVYVSASHVEGLPLTVLEAMSWGVPVVASDIPPHRELLGPGDLGRLFPVGSATGLADAVVATMSEEAATRAVADRARATVGARYPLERMVDQYRSLYWAAVGASTP
jgi:glycosyltransferase involved in cell wall biosynthesis